MIRTPGRTLVVRGALTVAAAFDPSLGRGVTLVRVARGEEQRERSLRIAEALARVSSPHTPRVLAVEAERGEVVLDFPAELHLGEALERLAPRSVPYPAGAALTRLLTEALAAAHGAEGGPVVLGAIHASNFLVASDGALALLGFGEERGDWPLNAIVAPSVAAGGACTPSTDVYAGLLFMRSLLRYVSDLPAPLVALLEGRRDTVAAAFARSLGASLLGRGLDAGWSLRWLERFWAIVGKPRREDLARILARVASSGRVVVRVDPGCLNLHVEGRAPINLARRRALRGVLAALLAAKQEGKGELAAAELVQAGWPGETFVGDSGLDRLYVTISSLRALGIPVERGEAGYTVASAIILPREA